MAQSGSRIGGWIAVLVLLLLLVTGLFWPVLDNEPPPAQRQAASPAVVPTVDSVRVVSWDWRDDRSGQMFAVWGILRNLSSHHIDSVVLELRTEDENEQPLTRYPIVAKNLPPGQEKPFRGDVPRTGREARGFLEIKQVAPAKSDQTP